MAKLTGVKSCPTALDISRRVRNYRRSLATVCSQGGADKWSPAYKDVLADYTMWQRYRCYRRYCQSHGLRDGSGVKWSDTPCQVRWENYAPLVDKEIRDCLGHRVTSRGASAVRYRSRPTRRPLYPWKRAMRGFGELSEQNTAIIAGVAGLALGIAVGKWVL